MFPLTVLLYSYKISAILLFITLIKLKNNLKTFESFEFLFVKTNSREKYFSLIKIFIFNFTIGHLLSILLNLMATSSPPNESWYTRLNIQ